MSKALYLSLPVDQSLSFGGGSGTDTVVTQCHHRATHDDTGRGQSAHQRGRAVLISLYTGSVHSRGADDGT